MEPKTLSFFALSFFALIFLISGVSAVDLNPITNYVIPQNVSQETGFFEIIFDLTNTGVAGNLNFSESELSTGSLSFNDTTITASSTETIRAIVTFSTSFSGIISGVINVTGTGMSTYETLPFSVNILESPEMNFCLYDGGVSGNPGDLAINIKDITVKNGFGEDEEWLLFDEIEVDIEIENEGDYDIDDISIEWGLYNPSSNEWAIEIDEVDEINLKDGDDATITLTFRIDDDLDVDLDELEGNYRLYVKATGEVDDDENPKTCVSDSESVSIEGESNFVILTDIQYPESISCGSDVQIIADIWNIGDKDQEDIYIILYNSELGINEKIEIGDIDKFEDKKLDVFLKIPSDVEEKIYFLEMRIYDEDDDIYENDFDDDPAVFSIFLNVVDCIVQPDLLISATLESDAKAGEDLVIRVVLTNTAKTAKTFTLDISGHENWARILESPETILINGGDFEEAYIKFNVNKGISGTNTFSIRVYSDSELLATQPCSVNIEPRGFLGITGFPVLEGDAYLWGLGILNIILVVVIIIVAIRIARKKK